MTRLFSYLGLKYFIILDNNKLCLFVFFLFVSFKKTHLSFLFISEYVAYLLS